MNDAFTPNAVPIISTIRKTTIHRLPVSPAISITKTKKKKQKQQQQQPPFSNKQSSSTSLDMSSISSGWNAISSSISNVRLNLHGDPNFVLATVLLLSIFGITLERRTTIGKALSAPITTMAFALTVANLGLIPFTSPIYTMVNKFLVPMAVPLLLFDSDLRRVLTDTGSLLTAFFVGALSTIVGTLIAYPLVPMKKSIGPDSWKVASALAARHIGGAINFVAVADTLNVGGSAVAAAIAADNVVVALYFAFLFFLAKSGEPTTNSNNNNSSESESIATKGNNNNDDGDDNKVELIMPMDPEDVSEMDSGISMPSLGTSLAVSTCLVSLGAIVTKQILPSGTSSLPLISVLTVIAATLFPKFFRNLRTTGNALGIIFMQMFFASSGAAGSIRLVFQSAPSLFLFSLLQIGIHFLTLVGLGHWILRLDLRELYLSSNANVGGPTTAAAMAQAKDWPKLVLPALLIGILGYASATAIALALGPLLLRIPVL